MNKPTKFVYEKERSIEVEKGYIVDNYLSEKDNVGYSIVRTHLNGKHPFMKNIKSNRTYYLLNGRAKFYFENEEMELNEGEMLTIPLNTKYAFEGIFEAILVDCPAFNAKNDILYDENMNNYIIIHGSFGSKDGNWFPWLKDELMSINKQVIVPQMPVGVENQNFENWSNILNELEINENTTIVAHSIAPIFVCKYLITNKIKVKKLIFVCGFNNYLGINSNFDAVNKPMFINNFEDVKKYCENIVCYYSDNDPYVKFETEKEFADKLTNKQYVIKNGGHINSESGYTKFEEILKEI